jgi:AmmeMemoRadiSam system protein B
MPPSRKVRACQVCGLFYPEDPVELADLVDGLLVPGPQGEEPIHGLIAPHAGYEYSGGVAGAVYGKIRGKKFDRVVVISPSHAEFFEGATVYDGDAYATPLGEIPVDDEFCRLLVEGGVVSQSIRGHGREHALEVQLPFLQRAIGEFSLIPIVIGHQSPEVCFELGAGLGEILKTRDALIVASTDLSHFHTDREARVLDKRVMARISSFEEDRLMEDLESGYAEACGGGPVVALLTAMRHRGYSRSQIVAYATSADASGDYDRVVGYTGAVIA